MQVYRFDSFSDVVLLGITSENRISVFSHCNVFGNQILI